MKAITNSEEFKKDFIKEVLELTHEKMNRGLQGVWMEEKNIPLGVTLN